MLCPVSVFVQDNDFVRGSPLKSMRQTLKGITQLLPSTLYFNVKKHVLIYFLLQITAYLKWLIYKEKQCISYSYGGWEAQGQVGTDLVRAFLLAGTVCLWV